MKSEDFVKAVRAYVLDSAVDDVLDSLSEPSGRDPSDSLVELSEWFLRSSLADQSMIRRVVHMGSDHAVFGFLCVLDGVRKIHDGSADAGFKLFYADGEEEVQINDGSGYDLHDLLNLEQGNVQGE